MRNGLNTKIILAAAVLTVTVVSAGCGDESEGPVQVHPVDLTSGESGESDGEGALPEGSVSSEGNQEESSRGENGEGTGQQETQKDQPPGNRSEEAGPPGDGAFGFDNLTGWNFSFSSGVGAWFTELFIEGDGSFEGHYQDAYMGDMGENYPNGTLYLCDFTGSFGELEKVDEYTYKMKLLSLVYEQEPEKEEIVDGVRQIYSTASGLVGGEEFYLYLPGAKLDDLPEEYLYWVDAYNLEDNGKKEISFYGLYNIEMQAGFFSNQYEEQSLEERIAMEISFAEERAGELEKKLQESVTQLDMNTASQELFQNWDDTLNIVWKLLEAELDSTAMEALRAEEREWIAAKDAEVEAAGQAAAGGSVQSMDQSLRAAELTQKRVYELAEYAK